MQDDATAPAPAIRAGHLTATDAMAAATGAARAADHLGCIPVLAPDPGLAHAAGLAGASGFPTITLPRGADTAALPLPVQMIAPKGARALLIAAAGWLEAEGRWSYPLLVAGLAA